MPLKAVLDTLDGVDAAIQPLYKKGDDNKFRLEVEGLVPAEKLVEFRNNNITLKQALEKYEGLDPEKYRKLLDLEKLMEKGGVIKQEDIDKIVGERTGRLQEEFNTKLTEKDTEITTLNTKLSSVLIDSAAKSAAVTAGVISTAVDDVVLRAKAVFHVKNGEVVALDNRGQVMYGKNATDPLTISEWITDLKKTAPHLFQGMRGSGAGGGGGGPGGLDTSKMSATQKISAGLASR